MMGIFRINREQYIPKPISEVWAFFSQAANLQQITPQELDMRITSPKDDRDIYPGQIITYTLKPLLGIRINWMTEITHVTPGSFFVDEQRSGPYKLWHHQHHFEPRGGGTLMTDIVHYALPLGPLGRLAHSLFVRRQLLYIFDYRMRVIANVFEPRNI